MAQEAPRIIASDIHQNRHTYALILHSQITDEQHIISSQSIGISIFQNCRN